MSQYDFGTIDPNTKSGTALATDLNSWRTALHSQHSGSSAPAYIATGMMWADNTSADLILNMYDGTDSIPLLQLDATNNRVIWTIEDGSITGTYVEAARATYGGTANAITLTSGASLAALTTGMKLRFRATAANTGATTINLDGIGAIAVKNVQGNDIPAGQIRTTEDSTVIYDGTNWVHQTVIRTISAAQATTSGTSFTVSGLDTEATEIRVFLNQVSLSGTDSLLVQLGTSGGVITSGYLSISDISGVVGSSAGFISQVANAVHLVSGVMNIHKAESGVWVAKHNTRQNTNLPAHGAGILTGAGDPITSVTLTRDGTNTFDAGSFYVETRR